MAPCVSSGVHGERWWAPWQGNCTALHGSCEFDYGCTHNYFQPAPCRDDVSWWACVGNGDDGTEHLEQELEAWYERTGKPIWISEFACNPWAERACNASLHARLMEQVVPVLEASPRVFRYAWFAAYEAASMPGNALNRETWSQLSEVSCPNNSWTAGYGDASWQIQTNAECVAAAEADASCATPLVLNIGWDACYCATDACDAPVATNYMTTYRYAGDSQGLAPLGERVRHQALTEAVPRDRRQEQHAVERDRAVEPELREEPRRLGVAAPPRELLGRPAPGVARVRGRAGLEQEAHALERAVARRGVQRRVAPPVGRRAARAVREIVADLVHLQHLHDERRARRPVRRAGHEERRPARRVRDAQVGAVLQERLEALHRRGDVAGHHAPRVRRPRDEAAAHRGQDVARAPRRAGAHGGVQRRVPVRVGLDGRAPLQQLEDAVRPVVRARVEERRPAALVRAAQAAVVARPEEGDLALASNHQLPSVGNENEGELQDHGI